MTADSYVPKILVASLCPSLEIGQAITGVALLPPALISWLAWTRSSTESVA